MEGLEPLGRCEIDAVASLNERIVRLKGRKLGASLRIDKMNPRY